MKRDSPFDVGDTQLQTALARKVASAIELLAHITRSFEPAALASSLGAFIVIDEASNNTVGAGMIL